MSHPAHGNGGGEDAFDAEATDAERRRHCEGNTFRLADCFSHLVNRGPHLSHDGKTPDRACFNQPMSKGVTA